MARLQAYSLEPSVSIWLGWNEGDKEVTVWFLVDKAIHSQTKILHVIKLSLLIPTSHFFIYFGKTYVVIRLQRECSRRYITWCMKFENTVWVYSKNPGRLHVSDEAVLCVREALKCNPRRST